MQHLAKQREVARSHLAFLTQVFGNLRRACKHDIGGLQTQTNTMHSVTFKLTELTYLASGVSGKEQLRQTMKTASCDEEIAFKQKEKVALAGLLQGNLI